MNFTRAIETWTLRFRYVGSQKLSGMLLQPYDLYKEGWADAYLMGMVNQVRQTRDRKYVDVSVIRI